MLALGGDVVAGRKFLDDFDVGCQSKPTVLRMPFTTDSTPLPSRFMRKICECWSDGSQMLHGAPTGK